jgi:hypothetical protein
MGIPKNKRLSREREREKLKTSVFQFKPKS